MTFPRRDFRFLILDFRLPVNRKVAQSKIQNPKSKIAVGR